MHCVCSYKDYILTTLVHSNNHPAGGGGEGGGEITCTIHVIVPFLMIEAKKSKTYFFQHIAPG